MHARGGELQRNRSLNDSTSRRRRGRFKTRHCRFPESVSISFDDYARRGFSKRVAAVFPVRFSTVWPQARRRYNVRQHSRIVVRTDVEMSRDVYPTDLICFDGWDSTATPVSQRHANSPSRHSIALVISVDS